MGRSRRYRALLAAALAVVFTFCSVFTSCRSDQADATDSSVNIMVVIYRDVIDSEIDYIVPFTEALHYVVGLFPINGSALGAMYCQDGGLTTVPVRKIESFFDKDSFIRDTDLSENGRFIGNTVSSENGRSMNAGEVLIEAIDVLNRSTAKASSSVIVFLCNGLSDADNSSETSASGESWKNAIETAAASGTAVCPIYYDPENRRVKDDVDRMEKAASETGGVFKETHDTAGLISGVESLCKSMCGLTVTELIVTEGGNTSLRYPVSDAGKAGMQFIVRGNAELHFLVGPDLIELNSDRVTVFPTDENRVTIYSFEKTPENDFTIQILGNKDEKSSVDSVKTSFDNNSPKENEDSSFFLFGIGLGEIIIIIILSVVGLGVIILVLQNRRKNSGPDSGGDTPSRGQRKNRNASDDSGRGWAKKDDSSSSPFFRFLSRIIRSLPPKRVSSFPVDNPPSENKKNKNTNVSICWISEGNESKKVPFTERIPLWKFENVNKLHLGFMESYVEPIPGSNNFVFKYQQNNKPDETLGKIESIEYESGSKATGSFCFDLDLEKDCHQFTVYCEELNDKNNTNKPSQSAELWIHIHKAAAK